MNLFENIEKSINNRDRKNEINDDKDNININNENISENEIDLAQKLDAIEIFTVDRIEDGVIVLEDRNTGKMYDVNKDELPEHIKSGDIIKKINGKYFIDKLEKESIEKRIEDKMNDLWN